MAACPQHITTNVGRIMSNTPNVQNIARPAAPASAWVDLAGGKVGVHLGYGQPPGVLQRGGGLLLNDLAKVDPSSEVYYDGEDAARWWKILHAPDKLEAVVRVCAHHKLGLSTCRFYAHQAAAAAAECVICHYATASVGDRCRYCAGQMPSGWELPR